MRNIVIGLDPSLTSFGWSNGTTHAVITTSPRDTRRERCNQIFVQLVSLTERLRDRKAGDHVLWAVEAPMLISHGDGASTHLFDAGYLYAHIDDAAETADVEKIEVPIATLRKFVTGKGNTPKAEMPLRVYKKWGVEFQHDRGADRCFAYCLYRYGLAYLANEIEHVPAAARGVKRRTA